jgi:hypothetical protein
MLNVAKMCEIQASASDCQALPVIRAMSGCAAQSSTLDHG